MPAPIEPRHRGVFPVVPTTFTETGELDLASQLRCVDFMIDAGSDGLCILANYSEQFALADDERETLTRIWEETVDKERGEAAEAQREARDILLRNNISIKTATQQEATEARRRLMATQDQVVAEIGIDRELVAGVLREIRAAGVGV